MLDLPQANISQHLLKLRQANVVKTRRSGKYVFYSLKDLNVLKASDLLRDYVASQNSDPSMKNSLEAPLASLTPLVHDPVCRMQLSPKNAGFKHHYRHRDYFFCASGCLKIFQKSPQKYA
jgi:YHS domain-containing protein